MIINRDAYVILGFSLFHLLAHLSRRLKGELIVMPKIRRPWSSLSSIGVDVNIFKQVYL